MLETGSDPNGACHEIETKAQEDAEN